MLFFKSKKKKTTKKKVTPSYNYQPLPQEPVPQVLNMEYEFSVTGMNHYNKNIASIGTPSKGYKLTPAQLANANKQRYYQYFFKDLNIQLIPEPSNPYDKNAIMVIANGVQIGYVPSLYTAIVMAYIRRPHRIDARLSGGNYIQYDFNEWVKDKYPYYCNITITLVQ